MTSIIDFKLILASIVAEETLHESSWAAPKWGELLDKINQNILDDAFNQHPKVEKLLSSVGHLEIRSCKTLGRVKKKMTEQRGAENYFKCLTDFVAVRILCEVTEIPEKIDAIRAIILQNSGEIYVRGSSKDNPYGLCKNGNKYTDITQYVYIYLRKVGYPVEIQICHKFAARTFKLNAELRDNRRCGKVDLKSKGFYMLVKQYILTKANGQDPGSLEKINTICTEIHNGNVPQDLQQILDTL